MVWVWIDRVEGAEFVMAEVTCNLMVYALISTNIIVIIIVS